MIRHVVSVSVVRMTESCRRTTYYVRLTTDEGFTIEPCSYHTGHEYMEDGRTVVVPGMDAAEALQLALHDAGDWSDLFRIPVTPYEEDGIVVEPSLRPRRRFENQRRLRARRQSDQPA